MINQEIEWLRKEKYDGVESEAFHADCARLKAGEPLAYVIGHVPFLDCTIYLDSKPLIPRPETEFWVEQAIATITRSDVTQLKVLDLCAGSGCIGVAVAKAVPQAEVYFAEIAEPHHATISKNVLKNKLTNTTHTYAGNLFSEIPDKTHYNHIFSNPPYIDSALDRTEVSVKGYEPHLALYGGEAGMQYISEIIAAAPRYLCTAGTLWLEHEPEQSAAIRSTGTTYGFRVTTHRDQYDIERYSQLVLQ